MSSFRNSVFFLLVCVALEIARPNFAAQILFIVPGYDALDPAATYMIHQLQANGHKILITTPRGSSPDLGSHWPRMKIGKFYLEWLELDKMKEAPDALVLFGSKSQAYRPVHEPDALQAYLNNPEIKDYVKKALLNGLPIASITQGTELLASIKNDRGESLLKDRWITAPNGALDKRRPLGKLFGGPAQMSKELILRETQSPDHFVDGPSTRIGSFGYRIVQDQHLLTGRSGRDAVDLAHRLNEVLRNRNQKYIRHYFIEYPTEGTDYNRIGVEVLEAGPQDAGPTEVFYYSRNQSPLKDHEILNMIDANVGKGAPKKLVFTTQPGFGENYGLRNYFQAWTKQRLAKMNRFVLRRVTGNPDHPVDLSRFSGRWSSRNLPAQCLGIISNFGRRVYHELPRISQRP